MTKRPILVAMNNPHGTDPRQALWPSPPGSAGWRVWRMCGEPPRAAYLRAFERRNVLNETTWDRWRARQRGLREWARAENRTVVVFGRETAWALGLPRTDPGERRWVAEQGVVWYYLPHPSGRCHWYNEPIRWRIAAALLTELMEEGLALGTDTDTR